MNLSPYLETVRDGVLSAASLADDSTRQVAERLGAAVESSTRLALIQSLSDAAAQVSAEIAPTSVELRMTGTDPELVVVVPAPAAEPTLLLPDEEPSGPGDPSAAEDFGDDEPVARVSLRLPASVKTKVDQKADHDGISTNAWLLRAVMGALGDRPLPPVPPTPPPPGTDSGPFGQRGPLGPGGVFGPAGTFGSRGRGPTDVAGGRPPRRGTVQGWVR